MLCRIAGLLTEVPEAWGMTPRLQNYKTEESGSADICISAECYRWEKYPNASREAVAYWESGVQFSHHILSHGGLVLHASAIVLDGHAYLFSGPSGIGKSTHTSLWQQAFPTARVFNDDKPAIRLIDGHLVAFGTPWSGKGVNVNLSAPLAGICFLSRGEENVIERLSTRQATLALMQQTMRRFARAEMLDRMLQMVERIGTACPVYAMAATQTVRAAHIAYDAMRAHAGE